MWLIAFVSMPLSPSYIQGVRRGRHKIYFACWWDQVVKKKFISTYVGNWTLYGAVVSVHKLLFNRLGRFNKCSEFLASARTQVFVRRTNESSRSFEYPCRCRDSSKYVCVCPRFCLTSRKNNFPGNFRTLWFFDKAFFTYFFYLLNFINTQLKFCPNFRRHPA